MMRLIFKNIPMNAELEWQGGKGARRLRGKEARRQGGKEAKKPSCHLAILPSFPSPNSELRIPNSAIGMVKVHLMLISLLLLCVISGTIADGQQSFTYPKPDGEVRNFDDENPIWGPGQALSFERSYKSGSGGQGIYWYQPFGENKPCFPLAVQEEGLSIDFGQSKQSKFFASYFSWVGTDISTYRFVYTQLPDIYWGKFTLLGSEKTLNPTLNMKRFVSVEVDGKFVENKYADYSEKNNYVAYVSGRTGQGDIYIKRFSEDAKESDPGSPVTENDVLELAPHWSPDGKHIVYSSEPEGNMDIFLLKNVLAANGNALNPDRKPTPLTSSRLDETYPTWSPDGELIAFYSIRLESDDTKQMQYDSIGKQIRPEKRICDLWVVKLNDPEPILIKIAEYVYRQDKRGPVWLPPLKDMDGRYLIYTSGDYDKIYVLNVDKAMANPGEVKPILIEGLAGYQYKHITDLDCTELRSSSILLAYSALNKDGQKRIYVEIIEYKKPNTWRVKQSVTTE